MSDDEVRRRLERLSERSGADDGDAYERLRATRDRRVRRRRVTAGTLALVIAVGGSLVAFAAIRNADDGTVVAEPSATATSTWAPPAVPYLWPENWTRPEDGIPAETQAKVDAGQTDLQWRTDPKQVAENFAKNVIGWPETILRPVSYGKIVPGLLFELTQPPPSCPSPPGDCGVPDHQQYVWLQQPATTGDGGIWAVAGAWADTLDVGIGHQLTSIVDEVAAGATLHMSMTFPDDQTVSVGYTGTTDCASIGAAATQGADPGLGSGSYDLQLPDPDPVPSGCGDVAAGYAFAYTVPSLNTPTGDPFLESGNVEALTAMPLLVDLGATVSSPQPTSHEPVDHVTIACDANTVAIVGSDTVIAQPDGVHVTLENGTQDLVSLGFENAGGGDGGGPGTTRLVVGSPPGPETVTCQSMSRMIGSVVFTVVDPNGVYVAMALDCPNGMWGSNIDYATEPAGSADPIRAARDHLKIDQPGDTFVIAGYPEAKGSRTVLLVRDGVAIRSENVVEGKGGWFVNGESGCSS